MLLLVSRYAFVFWLVISSNKGDNLRLSQTESQDQDIYKRAACTARCMQEKTQQQDQEQEPQLNVCFEFCQKKTLESVRKIQENLSLKLICRDDRSLTFRIDLQRPSAANDSQMTNDNSSFADTIYFIKIHTNNSDEHLVYLSDENFFTITELKSRSAHNITAVAIHANNEYSVIAKDQHYETLRRSYKPAKVSDIHVIKFHQDETNEKRLMASIAWKPASDMTCHYNIICYSPEIEEFDMTPLEIRNPRQLFTYNLENLTFSSAYKVGIRAKNPNNISQESELFWMDFKTPSCVEWYGYNFNICAPLEPQGLLVDQLAVDYNVYALNISWEQPQHMPEYYTVHVLDLTWGGDLYVRNVSKQMNTLFLPKVTILSNMFEVDLTAYTAGGSSTAMLTGIPKMVAPDKNSIVKLISAIFAPIFCIVILSLTTFIICHRKAKLRRYQERCKYFEELEKKAPIDPKATFDFPTKSLPLLTSPEDLTQFQLDLEDKIFFKDAMEISRNDVTLHEILGEGAFGLVRRGIYNDDKLGPREVAVKMLKDQPSIDDVRAFRREIEVMKSVEKHPNIVGIIGHCTTRYSEMMLLTEYCSFGNLLDFLRDEWKYLHEINLKSNYPAIPACVPNSFHKSSTRKMERHKHYQYSNKCSSYKHHPQQENNNRTSSNVFNLDLTIIEKLKIKYKNLSPSHQLSGKDKAVTSGNTVRHNETESMDSTNTTSTIITTTTSSAAADNKSYGYDAICTNSCKCQVDVIIQNLDPSNENREVHELERILQQKKAAASSPTASLPPAKTIEIKNCECQQLLLAKKNKINVTTSQTHHHRLPHVENRVYFKYATYTPHLLHQNQTSDTTQLMASIKREPLSAADLLDIARQVAVGMEFLATNKVVHRDLAARNVLVAPDRTIKIADFGLSRDIYQENIYKKTGNGKLPIKWLALESMTHQVYTTQSDVWSYGILLYEIITLGGTPYPSIPASRLLHLLKTGYRMEKPRHCGEEFYNLMRSCWDLSPNDRPNFTEILKIIDVLMDEAPQYQMESLITHEPAEAQIAKESTTIDDSYLKPL